MFIGSCLQGYANGTFDTLAVALLLLVAGYVAVSLVFPGSRSELRAFLLTYGVCLFAGGLAQCYSLAVFHDMQSTTDAFTFFELISPQPPFMTLADMPPFNSPLAVVAWQQIYKVTWLLGLEFGPYAAVMFNALVMGLTASVTVQTARELFGNDAWRLGRVGTMFAFCGLFILFGAVMLRDCFVVFLNSVVLLMIVRWLVMPTIRNVVIAAVLTGVSASAMLFLRVQATMLFGVFWFLAFVFWFLAKRLDTTRAVTGMFALVTLLIARPYLESYMRSSREAQGIERESYAEKAASSHSDDSLGMRLIINQPLPIRLLLGSGSLMVCPIPLWIYFNIHGLDYDWIRGYHGIYQVLVLPLVFAGGFASFSLFQSDRKRAVPLLYLVVYLMMGTVAVVATSMEQRHLAQFMTSAVILGAVPDTRKKSTREEVVGIAQWWVVVVVIIHLAWAIMKVRT